MPGQAGTTPIFYVATAPPSPDLQFFVGVRQLATARWWQQLLDTAVKKLEEDRGVLQDWQQAIAAATQYSWQARA